MIALGFGLANALGRPGMLAYGSDGMVLGSAVGGLVIDASGYRALGLAVCACGVLAGVLASRVALVRGPRDPFTAP